MVEAIGDHSRRDPRCPVDGRVHRAAGRRTELPVQLIVMVAAMTPTPGESPGEWWDATRVSPRLGARLDRRAGARSGRRRSTSMATFLHDVPDDVDTRQVAAHVHGQSGKPFEGALAAAGVAGRADPVPALSRRPTLPGRVPAPRGQGAARASLRTRWTGGHLPACTPATSWFADSRPTAVSSRTVVPQMRDCFRFVTYVMFDGTASPHR